MMESPSIVITVIAFLLLLGPLVVVHELGHYLVGRWCGVKADVFSVGFGKELAGWTDRRGTRWKLCMLPLGGYVQFAGDMNPASVPGEIDQSLTAQERAGLFQVKPLWQRSLIVAAGPVTNLLFAILIFSAFFLAYGKPVAKPDIAGIAAGSRAEAAGFLVGDRIVAIDGEPFASVTDMREHVLLFPDKVISVGILRDGRELVFPLQLDRREFEDQFGNKSVIGDWGIRFGWPAVGGVMPASPAEKAGLKSGDRIVAIDGQPVDSADGVAELIKPKPGRIVSVEVLRDGTNLVLPVTAQAVLREGRDGAKQRVGVIGIQVGEDIPWTVVPVGPIEALVLSWQECVSVVRMTATGLGQILTGGRSVKELSGPVRMAKFSGETFSLGWQEFVSFIAFVSINLAFINLLPIPALDGGHLALYAAEAVRRKPLGMRSQEWAFRTGLALVLALMLFVTINDLASLPVFGG